MNHKYLDFDKKQKEIFDNLYLSDLKIVVKCPLQKEEKHDSNMRFEKFNLADSIFLFTYD